MRHPSLNFKTMANASATKDAPSKKSGTLEEQYLNQTFDADKKYMFELTSEALEREHPIMDMVTKRPAPHKKYKPFHNIVLTSQIVWNGQRRGLRYYDGCDSIFIDEQPKDKDTIEQLIKQTNRDKYNFLDGKFGAYGDERLLLLYLNICSWNSESPFRTRTADAIFKPVNAEKKATLEEAKLDQTEEALELAKNAKKTKMMIHANYLGIAVIDYDSGNELTDKQIRTAYRKEALRNSANFIETYGNESLEIKYYIDQALRKVLISNKLNPNKAAWASSGNEIVDISGLKSHEAIAQRLFEFSQTEEGEEFLIQLKAVSEQ